MPERVVLIGADGPSLKAVRAYMRTTPEVDVLVIYPESNPLPEFICGAVDRYMSHGLDFSEQLRAFGVDRENKRVLVREIITGQETAIDYDKLIFASGAAPDDMSIRGEHFGGVVKVANHESAQRLRPMDGTTVVVGSGNNALLSLSALMGMKKGQVEVVMPEGGESDAPLSEALTAMVRHHLEESGVVIHEGHKLERIETTDQGLRLVTDQITIDAVRVVNAGRSVPVTHMAIAAGIETDGNGAIKVDTQLRTTDPDIFACGSCASFVTSDCSTPIPGMDIRSTEPRQAAVLAASLRNGDVKLIAPSCAYSLDMGALTIAGAGLTVAKARQCGFPAMSATVIQFDRAHFMPDAELMTLELVFDGPTRRVLGIQGLGKSGDALRGRISAVSAILGTKPTIEDISNLEIAYSPPFASAMDVLNTVANVADNMLAGINEGISAQEFLRLWEEREENGHFILDCRELGNAQPFLDRHPGHWNHIPQGELARRITEVPTDRKIILLCNTGTRSYEAQVLLKHAGREDVVNVDGGMSAVRQSGGNL